ncbi:26S proteasome non-ATPase regulatory subunit 5 [Halteromyces radiatus]|uniref:26S proteasome non-ATPase regulatory subunit 5 n=1 Tax=Halteromyces radiatus TaxID=101107 RepID=UPI002220F526|nr:26S proteasome non-ATPase regulatory subunit 5 [Halteromyces radiatus]KAI8097236.1 26S proteasome non-ATPase regulatory subunit 5 [Halteromyces radiatus]
MPSISTPLEKAQLALSSNTSVEEKILALTAFSTSLGDQVQADEAQAILSVLPLSLLYGTLNHCVEHDYDDTSHDHLPNVLCDLIRKLLGPFPYSVVSQGENRMYLEQGLQHFTPSIRYLSLQQVEKCLNSPLDTVAMIQSDFLPMVSTTVAFQDSRTAFKAVDILYKACLSDIGSESFFQSSAIQLLQSIMQINGTVGFRVYDLMMKIAGYSDRNFELCESSGILNQFMEELNTNDLLLRMNAIELLNEVAASPSGLQFLIKAHLMNKLVETLDIDDDSDVAVALTKCAVIKFFGSLGANKEVNFTNAQQQFHIIERLEKCIDSDNKEIETVSLAAVGLIGSHLNGLQLVQSNNSLMANFFGIARTASGDTKAVVLQSLSKMIGISDSEETFEQVEQRTSAIYPSIPEFPNVIKGITALAKLPVDNIRVAAFAVLEAIATRQWGRQEMARNFEFLGYLLDRSNESTQIGQMWKYAIVKTLVETGSNAESILGRHYSMLTQYIRQGPYYRAGQVTMAMESG